MPAVLAILTGLVVLLIGADLLVRGATRLALAWGLSPLVVGLTIVAFGTSAPELAVNVQSAFLDRGALGLGNVLGSNVFNTLLILGVVAVLKPLDVQAGLVRLEVPLVLVASVGAFVLASDGLLSRWDGLLLLALIGSYTAFLVGSVGAGGEGASGGSPETPSVTPPEPGSGESDVPESQAASPMPALPRARVLVSLVFVLGGLTLLVLGSRWLVGGAVRIAEAWGVSPLVIGLTIVAGGTSLPELATSAVAGLKGQVDMAVGNVLGSNLFNLLFVLGTTAVLDRGGLGVPENVLAFDFPLLVAVSLATMPIFLTGLVISRREGALFVVYYIGFVAYLVLEATGHALLGSYRRVLVMVVLPLTLLALGLAWVTAAREQRARRSGASRKAP